MKQFIRGMESNLHQLKPNKKRAFRLQVILWLFNTQMKLMCEMCISEIPTKNQSEETEGAEWG